MPGSVTVHYNSYYYLHRFMLTKFFLSRILYYQKRIRDRILVYWNFRNNTEVIQNVWLIFHFNPAPYTNILKLINLLENYWTTWIYYFPRDTSVINSQEQNFLTSNKINFFNLINVHLFLKHITMSFNIPWPQNYNYNKTWPHLLLAWHKM
jgi:hypothetical protein